MTAKPAPLELAPFIMEDHQARVSETRRAINAGITAAERKGDHEEAKRLEKRLNENTGATGLRIRRRDTVYQKISDPRLLRACDTLRNVAEAMVTGQSIVALLPEPKEPPIDRDELLPAIKNPPRPADPINAWRRGQPTMKRVKSKDGTARDVKRPCPRTFPPKPVKNSRSMPKQHIAEKIFAISARLRSDARRASLWRVWGVCLQPLTADRAEIIRSIILDCISINHACELAFADPESDKTFRANKRMLDGMRQDLVETLERAAQYLEDIA